MEEIGKNKRKALTLAKKLGIIIKPTTQVKGRWIKGKTIYLRKDATTYTILHEIGHVLCGYMCCREHCEYVAHGAALALSKVYKIRINIKKVNNDIASYAGYSPKRVCAGIQFRKDFNKENKKSYTAWRKKDKKGSGWNE